MRKPVLFMKLCKIKLHFYQVRTTNERYLHETINSFSNDTEEITFMVEANKLVIKNYVELETSEIKKKFFFDL